jgi:Tfp pilus assembly protein FimT
VETKIAGQPPAGERPVKSKREAGVSLLELATIILMIGVVASIAIPNGISATRAYKLNLAATALAQQLNLCRQQAVRTNLPTTIRISGLVADIDINQSGTYDTADGPSRTLATDTNISITNPTVQNSTLGAGYVQYSSRGDIPIGDAAPIFRVTYGSRYRDVTVDNRGAVSVGAEQ